MVDDELAKKWGAWGGDRKLSPRFPIKREPDLARQYLIVLVVMGCVAAVLALMGFRV